MNLNSLLKKNPGDERWNIILPNGKNIDLSYGVNITKEVEKEIEKIFN